MKKDQIDSRLESLRTLLIAGWPLLLVAGCNVEESPEGDCDNVGSEQIFEDDFDGDNLDPSWTEVSEDTAEYSLTGDGELESGDGEVTFVNTSIETGGCYKVTTAFRTTLNSSIENNVDMMLMLNCDAAFENGYGLVLTSDPIDDVRDYALSIYLVVDSEPTELVTEFVGGTATQITGDGVYTLEGTYCDGCISFRVSDEAGNFDKTLTVTDSTYPSGAVGFHGDMNADSDTEQPQSIYFDYFLVVS